MNRISFLLLLLLTCSLQSIAQPAVVAASKMNVVYVGIPNPIAVAACGYPESAVTVTVDDGTVTKGTGAGEYDWLVTKPGTATVTVWGMKEGKKVQLTQAKFRVKYIPDPEAVVANKHGDLISKRVLQIQTGIAASIPDILFQAKFVVTKFKAETIRSGTTTYSGNTEGPYFSRELRARFALLSQGDKVVFSDIFGIGPDHLERKFDSIEFTITR